MPASVPVLLTLDAAPPPLREPLPATAQTCTSWETFLPLAPNCNLLVIQSDIAEKPLPLLRALRRHSKYFALPVFMVNALPEPERNLADGVFQDWSTAQQLAVEINALLEKLPPANGHGDQDDRLLRYLYSRGDIVLRPQADFNQPLLYRYPLLEAFNSELSQRSHIWLDSLLSRKLLETGELVDRVRTCPTCRSAHLNYVDCCPNCASVDIRDKVFLHCFTCGFVSPQDQFLHRGELSCPKCRTTLRHIGSDYDHALENLQCATCQHMASDPDVVARCIDCGGTFPPEQLSRVNLHQVQLSEAGKLAVVTGKIQDIYALFDQANYLAPEQFKRSMKWLMDLYDRYQQQTFSLLLISLDNIRQLVQGIGKAATLVVVEEFAARLRQIIRNTDFSTRIAENRIVLLLPSTTEQGMTTITQRINGFRDKLRVHTGDTLQFRMTSYAFPQHFRQGETPELIMARLVQQLEESL